MTRNFLLKDSSSAMVFDGSVADVWDVRMVGAVLSPRTRMIAPGRLYTFIVRQMDTSYRFNWPTTCRNAAPVNASPHSITVQNFIGLSGGLLQANAPGTSL